MNRSIKAVPELPLSQSAVADLDTVNGKIAKRIAVDDSTVAPPERNIDP